MHPRPRFRRRLLCCLALVAGCGEGPSVLSRPMAPHAPRLAQAVATTTIDDRVLFLPPLGAAVPGKPDNDATLLPVLRVEICVLGPAGCVAGAPLATLLPASPPAEKGRKSDDDDPGDDRPDGRLRLDGDKYQAKWQPRKSLDQTTDYRITVLANGVPIGRLDVDLLPDDHRARPRPGFVPLDAGRPVEIRFRVLPGLARTLAVTPASESLASGDAATLAAAAIDYHGQPVTHRAVAWGTSDPRVATVDAAGRVTAVGAGTALISASLDGLVASATITVVPAVIPVTLFAGERLALDAAAYLGTGASGGGVSWSSDNAAIVSVDANGVLTAWAVGTASVRLAATTPAGAATRTLQVTAALPGWCSIRDALPIRPSPFIVLAAGAPALRLSSTPPAGITPSWTSGIADPSDPSFDLTIDGLLTPRHAGSGTINVILPGTMTVGTGCVTVLGPVAVPSAFPAGVRLRNLGTLYIAPDGTRQSTVVTAEVYDRTGATIGGAFTYRFTVGDQSVISVTGDGSASGTITALRGGTSGITVSATSASGGLSGTGSVLVIDQRPPDPGPGTVTVTAVPDGVLRPGDRVVLTASGSSGPLDAIVWESTNTGALQFVSQSGSTATFEVVSGPPAGRSPLAVQVNARATRGGVSATGAITLTIGG